MTDGRRADQTSTHTLTLTFTVAAINEGAVEDFLQFMADKIDHHAYYEQTLSLLPDTLKAQYTL